MLYFNILGVFLFQKEALVFVAQQQKNE